jgi:hypothetical protein
VGRTARETALEAELTRWAAAAPEFSVAVLDRGGRLYAFRGDRGYETASVVKVLVLACLLLTAQDRGEALTAAERERAGRMIRTSDNEATTALFARLGGAPGLQAGAGRLGLAGTVADAAWGFTRTTVVDQVRLLDLLVAPDGPLSRASRDYAALLLGSVAADQAWGVPSVAAPGERTLVKNGWTTRSTEGHRWIVNTVGRVAGPGTDVSIAVLSHHHPALPAGIAAVEEIARCTRRHLDY